MRAIVLLPIMLCVCGTSLIPAAYGNDQETPLAGESFQKEVLGKLVTVHARNRKAVKAVSFGVQYLHEGPSF